MDKAGWHEFLVYALNRPLAFAIMHLAARLGRAAHLPLIGTFVNDAEIAREVLTDTAHFDSHSAGSLGVLVTQALGPYALLNMDGPEHRQLKRRLLDVFSTKYISLLLSSVTDPLIAELKTDLAAGRTVDFVAFMKTFASAMACAMIGVAVEPADQRRAYADMFALATEFTALAGLGKRRLSAAETAKAHHLTDRLAAHIRNSYDSETLRENSLTQQMRALGFPFEAAKGVVIIVMIGATELITYGVPRMLALLVDSGQMAKLRAHPALLDRAVDEGFRMVTPSNVVLRAVTADCEVRGVRFRRATRVLVVFRTIMRRDRHFPNGKRFDIERTIDPRFRRLLFGAGAPCLSRDRPCARRGPTSAGRDAYARRRDRNRGTSLQSGPDLSGLFRLGDPSTAERGRPGGSGRREFRAIGNATISRDACAGPRAEPYSVRWSD